MKKQISIITSIITSIIFILSLFAGYGINNNKEIKLRFDKNFPTIGFLGKDGNYTGFDIELANYITNKSGYKITPIPINWDIKEADLDSGNINCIYNGFTITGRKGKYEFTKPYMKI